MEDQVDWNIGGDGDLDTIWDYLPEEVVEEILLRLPVKTLLRFKRVSKLWYALISHPQFAKSHIDRANINNKGHNFNPLLLERYGLLCFESKPNPSLSLAITDVDDNRGGDRIRFKKQLRNPFKKDRGEAGTCGDERISGLGCQHEGDSNNYKAILAFRTYPAIRPEQIAVSVWNSKSGASSNKYYHDFPYSFIMINPNSAGATLYGTPHWVVSVINEDDNKSYRNKAIICFDMEEESFKEVSHPDSLTISSFCSVEVMGGLLCVVDTTFNGWDVWAMKEYGVKESWTKLLAISTLNSCLCYLNPLGFINTGEVLIHLGHNLVICNLETGKEDYIFSSQCDISYAITYVESLVSPNGHGP